VLDETTGKPVTHILKPAEIDALLKKHNLAKKDDKPAETISAQASNTDMAVSSSV